MKRILKNTPTLYIVITLLVLLSSCAQQGQPSGGPKDVTPPEVQEVSPPNQSTNFVGKKIIFTFDEYTQIQDASNQFFISPPLKNLPEFTIRKKSLIVTFQDTLRPNTTYNINFGESIKDINESNVLNNLSYAFSTGPYIDSLSLSGQVVNAFDKSTEKNVLVMLYDTEIDSLPMKKLPTYYTKCDDSGNFILTNLKEGKYKLIALKDINSNLLFDLPEEEAIGFIDTLVSPVYIPKPIPKDTTAAKDTLTSDSVKIKEPVTEADTLQKGPKKETLIVRTFTEEKPVQYLKKSYSPEYCNFVFVYNKPVQEIEMESLNHEIEFEWKLERYSENRDTVDVWLFIEAANHPDSFVFELQADTFKKDTVELITGREDKTIKKGKKSLKSNKLELKISAPGAGKIQHPNKGFKIKFNHPVLYSELPQIILTEESDTVSFTTSSDDPVLKSFFINYKWKENKNYRLLIPPKTFRDFYQLENDTFQVEFKAGSVEDYGNLILNFEMPETATPHILQLIDEKGKIVSEKTVTKSESITFSLLQSGNYKLKVIVDENANGKWDTGNYLRQQQPEKIILHKGPDIIVRSNWDLEVEWQLDDH